MNAIEVRGVHFRYPGAKTETIRGISFDVKQGEIFGFLGPSGAGKSTIQKILTGTLRNYSGSVSVLGKEMKDQTKSYYEKIGVDFEFPNFYSKFTALENLTYFASLYARETQDPRALLAEFGLAADAKKKVGGYSKGMKMRLGFVRAILHDPALLFLDEPTSGLDPANARIVKNKILEQKAQGKTILLTTHNMHDAEELCDHVAFIAEGTLKIIGTPHTLRQSGKPVDVEYRYLDQGTQRCGRCPLPQLAQAADFQQALRNGTLLSVHSKEQTLEDVFITLTGRTLG